MVFYGAVKESTAFYRCAVDEPTAFISVLFIASLLMSLRLFIAFGVYRFAVYEPTAVYCLWLFIAALFMSLRRLSFICCDFFV